MLKMEVVFKKIKKYVCDFCHEQFDWQAGKSIRYGKPEYQTILDKQNNEKNFCSKECCFNFKIKK